MVYYYVYKTADGGFAYGSIDTATLPSELADADGYVPSYKVSKYISDTLGIDKVGYLLDNESYAAALAKAKNQATMGAAEINAMTDKDITGNVGVAKKGTGYTVLKVDSGHYWSSPDYYVVDVSNGTVVTQAYDLGGAKKIVAELDAGYATPKSYENYTDYGKTIELPPSVQKQQQQLNNPKPKKAAAQKPIGSTASSIVSTETKNGYTLLHMDDGTYGVFVPSTGQYGFGYKSVGGAAKSANILISKTQQFQTMGVDNGVGGIGRLLGAYDNRIRDAFQQAANEMAAKQAKAMERFIQKRDELLAKVADGTMTQAEYDAWLKSQNMTQKWYKDMVDSLSQDMVDADKKAMEMLNGYVPRAYAEGMNYGTFQIENDLNVNTGFNLYNESTVAHLISNPEGSLLPDLPEAKVNELKDAVWSKQKINSCVTQSILQGESVPNAAKRLADVVGMSANAAMRTARTTLACAENMGHYNAGLRAIGMGIKLVKLWRATYDARTRHSHRALDLEEAEAEKEFSNGLMYPADPNGEPSEVYNCRCRMRWIEPTDKKPEPPDATKEGVAYEEWKNEKQLKEQAKLDKYKQQLDEIEAQEVQIKSAMPENKTYSGIWKDDVTLDDYAAKKASIEAKEEYYLQQIENAPNTPWGDAKVAEAKQHLLDLHDFQTNGEQYEQAKNAVQEQLDTLAEKKKSVQAKLAEAGGHVGYSDERKAAAFSWSSRSDADGVLRHYTSDAWLAASRAERDAVYAYTAGSGKFNRPLSGFQGGWGQYYYRGVGNVDLDYEGGAKYIRDMTTFIGRSSFDEDIWLRRGCGTEAMDSFFGLSFGEFQRMTDEELAGLVGHSSRISAFVSCGTAADGGAGFGGSVDMRIFVPSGTNAVYAEPFSAYSGASYSGKSWDGLRTQSHFGSEDETIIQRGTSFTCTAIERRGYTTYVELEAHPEDGYDLFGQEP